MQEHRAPLRESSNLNVLKAHDQANFIHWIAWDKTACFREEHRHSLWTLFLRKSSSCKLSMPFPTAGGRERACPHCDALGHERHLAARWALHLHCCLHSANTSGCIISQNLSNMHRNKCGTPLVFKAVLVPGLVYTSYFQKSSYLP